MSVSPRGKEVSVVGQRFAEILTLVSIGSAVGMASCLLAFPPIFLKNSRKDWDIMVELLPRVDHSRLFTPNDFLIGKKMPYFKKSWEEVLNVAHEKILKGHPFHIYHISRNSASEKEGIESRISISSKSCVDHSHIISCTEKSRLRIQ